MWTLAEANGYVIQFDPYSGAKSGITYRAASKTWGLGEVVILKFLVVLPEHVAYKLYMDNYFTSLRLFNFLGGNNIRAIGTVREICLGNFTLLTKRKLK